MRRPVTRFTMLAAAAALATGCAPVRHNLPPEQRLLEPGPGVGGPGPGVLGPQAVSPYGGPMGGMGGYGSSPVMPGAPMADGYGGVPMGPEGQFAAPGPNGAPGQAYPTAMNEGEDGDLALTSYCPPGGGIPTGGGVLGGAGMMPSTPPTMQVTFGRPDSMSVRYDATGAGGFDSEPLIVPARQNFPQGGIYRLKLTNIANREGVELYPTLELAYANPRTVPTWLTTRCPCSLRKKILTKY